MAVRSKTLGRVASILTLLCLIALLISFASDHWISSSGKDNTGFENLGLWSVCFREYYPPTHSLVNRKYDGCWWVLNKELDDLRNFLIPSWYESTQVLVTVSLVLVLIVCIILVINLINCFPYSPYRFVIQRYLALVSSCFLFLTALLLSVAVMVFGIRSSNTGNGWLQNNDENHLSWSFGMCILAAFLAILAGMPLLLQFLRIRAEKDDPSSEPKIFLTNEPPPATNYRYNNNSNRGRPMTEQSRPRDPAYVQRYQKADDSNRSLMNGPNERFAVDGRGEVYVNNLATFDENHQRPPPPRDQQRIPAQRNNAQPIPPPQRSTATRQLGRQGYPLRLNEPSFLQPQGNGSQNGSVNDEGSKGSKHPSLPEYVPKERRNESPTEDDSAEQSHSDDTTATKEIKRKKKKSKDDDLDSVKSDGKRKSRSRSKSGNKSTTRDRSRSNSRSRKKNRADSDTEPDTPSQRRRSKKRRAKSPKGESTDDEGSRTRQRSRRRKNSKSRSRSRDRMTSDSQLDSDTGSTRSRSRKKKKEKEFSRMDAKRRSASEDNLSVRSGGSGRKSRRKYDGNISDDFSGSEYSQKRSRRKGGESRTNRRDFSDTESVKSRTKRSGDKPKGTYSSYYEY